MTEDPAHAAAETGATSRLLIHAHGKDANGVWRMGALVRRVWVRVWARAQHADRHDEALPLLEIRDLQGHRLLTLTDASTEVDVVLPTGTYHVTTQVGDERRSYTVALEQGTTTNLYLQPRRLQRH